MLPKLRMRVAQGSGPVLPNSIDVAQDRHCSRFVVFMLKVCFAQELGTALLMIFGV